MLTLTLRHSIQCVLLSGTDSCLDGFMEASIEMVESLGDMYKNNPEFRKYYEKIDPDLPDFFGDSIAYYADELATRWLETQYLQLEE